MRRWCAEEVVWFDKLGYAGTMPFKHHAARLHRIPKERYRIRNWPAYEARLRGCGDLTLWVDEAVLTSWRALRRSTPGGQPLYADLAIEAVLTLRLVFHLALRQAAGLAASVLRLLGLDLPMPDHTTLSRRGRAFAARQPRVAASSGPVHFLLDSTGLELFGQGACDTAKHGRTKLRLMKLHLAVEAGTGQIVVHVLTEGTADDVAQVPDLLHTVEGTIASLTADYAYGGEPTYAAVAARQPDPMPDLVIPPRASAVPSTADPAQHTARDRHVGLVEPEGSPDMAEKRRMEWQWLTGLWAACAGRGSHGPLGTPDQPQAARPHPTLASRGRSRWLSQCRTE